MGRRGRSKERTPEYFTVDVERLDQEGRGIAHPRRQGGLYSGGASRRTRDL